MNLLNEPKEIIGSVLDHAVANQYQHDRISIGEHPSSPSGVVNKKTVGCCGRLLFYRHFDPKPFSTQALHAMNRGVIGEKTIQRMFAEAGLLLATNVKWNSFPLGGTSLDNDFLMSGETDIIIASPWVAGEAYVVECKSFTMNDFNAASLGMKPKAYIPIKGVFHNHKYLLQSMIYESEFSPKVRLPDHKIIGTILFYFDVSNFSNRVEFLIQLKNKETLMVDGVDHPEWKVSSIFKKMNKIRKSKLDPDTLPKRDYIPEFTRVQLVEKVDAGEVFKSRIKTFDSGESVGDFDCMYCDYRNECLKDKLPKCSTKSTEKAKRSILGDL